MNKRFGWQPIDTAPINIPIMTSIKDSYGVRNQQFLVKDKNLWWFPDKSMYVYYTPTHWMPLPEYQNEI